MSIWMEIAVAIVVLTLASGEIDEAEFNARMHRLIMGAARELD